MILAAFLFSIICHPSSVRAASHALTLYGTPKYAANFRHFEYVNPKAPKGGLIKLAEMGTFDTLNPFILKGVKAPGINMVFESLMTSSADEPETKYGLLAESVDVAEDGLSVSFRLRPQARWHDGTPVTPEDVIYSFTKLKEEGDPNYRLLFAPIESVHETGPRGVKFIFKDAENRELPIIAASMPIFPKHYFEKVGFDKATLESPVGSGPYRVSKVDPGRSITFERVKDYWGKNLPVNVGQNNFDFIRYDMYLDENSSLIAFKAGEYDFRREYVARNWATAYEDSPAVQDGRIVKREIEHKIPQGMQAFFFNTKQGKFADRRVREAISLTMDFEWLNKTIFYGAYTRNDSFFSSTPFAAYDLPGEEEKQLLEPYRDVLPEDMFTEKFTVATTDGSGNNRPNLVRAQNLLKEAGWVIKDGKRVHAETDTPLHVDFLLRQPTMERVIAPMRGSLEKLGITSAIRRVDDAQYQKRLDTRDFDVISLWVNRGVFFPGNEQMALWHSTQADIKGSNNLAGIENPAVDAALAALLSAKELDELIVAGRMLDRILMREHYVIPHWRSQSFRVAYWDKFAQPNVQAKYDLALLTWWVK